MLKYFDKRIKSKELNFEGLCLVDPDESYYVGTKAIFLIDLKGES